MTKTGSPEQRIAFLTFLALACFAGAWFLDSPPLALFGFAAAAAHGRLVAERQQAAAGGDAAETPPS